jgi:hypothetical protein
VAVFRHSPRAVVGTLAFLAGAATVFVLVLGWRVPVAHGGFGASVSVDIPLTGELQVAPLRPVVINDLRPGPVPARAQGTFTLRNQTGRDLSFSVTAVGGHGDLDSVLHLRLSADGGAWARTGTLAQLRGAGALLAVARGQTRTLAISAWIPADVHDGYAGRSADITLSLVAQPAAGAPR